MNEHYLISKFEQFERENSWEELFHKINVWSDEQEKNLSLTYDVSNCFDNMEKNRYRNVLPYDQNRVTLKGTGQVKTDYINASPLHMPPTRQNYILTQGPLQTTADDFWQMVYEQNTQVVIMLSKVVEKNYIKCHSYFPSKEEPVARFDLFECEWLGEEVKQHYICRQIRLCPLKSSNTSLTTNTALQDSTSPDHTINTPENAYAQGESRIIQHLQFVTWPDFGVPQHTDHFLEFLEHVRRICRTNSSPQTTISQNQISDSREDKLSATDDNLQPPIVCHCSAGIGRTGTYVIVDTILSILEQRRNGNIDVQELATLPTTINLVENEVEFAPNNTSEPENHQNLPEMHVVNESNKEATLREPQDPETKSKRKKIKQKGEPTAEPKHAPRELEPLDDIVSDMVVFIRKHRMGLIQTPSQLRFCWKAIVDWIKKEEQREAQESLFLETEKKKSRNSEPTGSSSIVDTKNTGNTSLEFRKEKVRQMRQRLREVEKRGDAGLLSRLIYCLHNGSPGSLKHVLVAAGSATVVVFSIVFYMYFGSKQIAASDVKTDL